MKETENCRILQMNREAIMNVMIQLIAEQNNVIITEVAFDFKDENCRKKDEKNSD